MVHVRNDVLPTLQLDTGGQAGAACHSVPLTPLQDKGIQLHSPLGTSCNYLSCSGSWLSLRLAQWPQRTFSGMPGVTLQTAVLLKLSPARCKQITEGPLGL